MNRRAPPKTDARKRMQMADLARLAGVSASTVSRALAGSDLISEETRSRIQTLARQFNYTVNSVATDLRSGVKRTIGVVVPYEQATRQSFADPFLHGMIGALADALTERGYEMLLSRIDADRLEILRGAAWAAIRNGVMCGVAAADFRPASGIDRAIQVPAPTNVSR